MTFTWKCSHAEAETLAREEVIGDVRHGRCLAMEWSWDSCYLFFMRLCPYWYTKNKLGLHEMEFHHLTEEIAGGRQAPPDLQIHVVCTE